MNDNVKTALFAGAAVGLCVIAGVSSFGAAEPVFFSDVGEELFPAFTNPSEANALEVWEFDAATGEAVPFNVAQKDGVWSIPSHHGYPADAKEQMAKAAGMLIGATKLAVRSDNKADHAKFAVIDPIETGLELAGRGKRVTIKDKAGSVLADLIVGHEIEGKTGQRYVRFPDKKRVYVADLKTELSTRFEDWIDQKLATIDTTGLDRIVYDNYSVDEERGTLVQGEKVVLDKIDSQWQLADLEAGKETDATKVQAALGALSDLKIVGVRAKPPGLTAQLETAQGIELQILADHLQRRGFFFSRDKLHSNEGDLIASAGDGLVYTLKFGEIVFGRGSALTSGEDKTAKPAAEAGEPGEETKEEGSHRYLMITAHFDETLLTAPEGVPLTTEHLDQRTTARETIQQIVAAIETYQSAHDQQLPESLADLTTGEAPALPSLETDPWGHDFVLEPVEDSFRVVSHGADGTPGGDGTGEDVASNALEREDELHRLADDHERHVNKIEESQKKAAELSERFGPWYYVISDESFRTLRLKADDLSKAATPAEVPGENG